MKSITESMVEMTEEILKLKSENERLKEELSTIQHECTREGCKYYDDDTYKAFFRCKAKKAFELNANSITTKYANCLKALEEIREIVKKYDAEVGDTIIANPIQDCYDIFTKINEVLKERE